MPTLSTWAGRRKFSYTGSVKQGTRITYGKGWTITVTGEQYEALLQNFAGQTVNLGTSRDNRPAGSVGEWLLEPKVTGVAIASYIGPILVHDGYAKKAGGPMIEFY